MAQLALRHPYFQTNCPRKNCRAYTIFPEPVQKDLPLGFVAKLQDMLVCLLPLLCRNFPRFFGDCLSHSFETKNKTKHVTGFCICSNQTKKSILPTNLETSSVEKTSNFIPSIVLFSYPSFLPISILHKPLPSIQFLSTINPFLPSSGSKTWSYKNI